MERTVRAHIEALEYTVRRLNEEMMREDDVRLRNELETKIRAAQTALKHYRSALELEGELSHER